MANKKTSASLPDFEGSLKKLTAIVNNMESGELTLEQALKQFEQGITLARQCQQTLKEAEQRVQQLMIENDPPSAE